MREAKFTEQQMVEAVKELEAGGDVDAIARRLGVHLHALPLEDQVRRDGCS